MNKSKFFLGLAVLIFAALGAFATVSNQIPRLVWYINPQQECVQDFLDIDCQPGFPDCVEQTTNDGFQLLYNDAIEIEQDVFECIEVLEEN